MSDPKFQPGYGGAPSHCSEATCQIARDTGVNTSPLGPDTGGFYNANKQADNLSKAATDPNSGWTKTTLSESQKLSNEGLTVVYA